MVLRSNLILGRQRRGDEANRYELNPRISHIYTIIIQLSIKTQLFLSSGARDPPRILYLLSIIYLLKEEETSVRN